ncbi:MAG: hypothetical protein WD648_04030 [Planctomycetaceae bacterium]
MFARALSRGTHRVLVALVILAVCGGVVLPQPAAAQSSLKETTSLGFVPDNVAFYGACLRNKEQFDAFVGSKAFAAIKELDVVKTALGQLEAVMQAPNGPLAGLNAFLEDDKYKDIRQTLVDMLSNEIFFYGDESYGELTFVLGRINSANRLAGVQAQLDGTAAAPLRQLSLMLRALKEHRDKLRVPGTLIGFRLKDSAQAQTQLKRMEEALGSILNQINPDLANRFQTIKIDGNDFLTLKLDGEMIPWDQVPIAALEQEPGEFDDLIAAIRKLPLTISLGVRGDYLLLGISDSEDIVKTATGGKLLHDRDELAALRANADKQFTGFGYINGEFAKKANQIQQQLDDLVEMVQSLVPLVPFDDDVKKELGVDIQSLRESMQPLIPEPGAQMGFTFLNGRGYEGYSYDWGENKFLDGSQKLSLLDHVGGDPVMFYAGRTKHSPEQYNLMVRILKRVYYYLDKYAVIKVADDNLERYTTYRDAALPHLERLEKITREKLVPAFKDGQGAIVIDAKSTSKSWTLLMPPSEKALPMLELALVYGVSDAALLRSAVDEYFAVAKDLLATLHKAAPEEFPELPLPEVATEKSDVGIVSYFKALDNLPVPIDSQLKPNAGLSNDVAVLSLTPGQTKRLLAVMPPDVKDGPLAERDRPLATAARCNWPAFVDAVVPWVEYAIKVRSASRPAAQTEKENTFGDKKFSADGDNEKPAADGDGGKPRANGDVDKILAQIHSGAEILKCYRGYSSVSYFEESVRVTHHESIFRDLEK